MYKISSFVFWLTLILYGVTLATVTYVGVYLTYVTIPVIVISGIIMFISHPKDEKVDNAVNLENINKKIEKLEKELNK